MAAKRTMNVHDALEYLENLEVSSDDETDDEDNFVSRGNLFILPPAQVDGRDTDEDSGDEDELIPNNLNGNQLLANAHVDLNTSNGHVVIGKINKRIHPIRAQKSVRSLKRYVHSNIPYTLRTNVKSAYN